MSLTSSTTIFPQTSTTMFTESVVLVVLETQVFPLLSSTVEIEVLSVILSIS